ncbi:hypothetical protein SAMN06297251_112132 [Fulvimarina manganoxydans]|uniref:Tat (Twin-arginine translocation) pathway signal sequence n=1 Tax=Fulvimarina manganoxydans TaxID=937218 RepID=A0A1W2D4D3_9HYPH|nr:hypothetical protein [Fulvimarina manganoxydans]SMC92395.1 hypothetical protein SAMN06297251_112132 [Fulvimarina manganoxydans]
MNRRNLLTGAGTVTLAAALPIPEAVAATLDPASAFVRRYLAAHAYVDGRHHETDEELHQDCAEFLDPVYEELIDAMPVPTTDAGLYDVIRPMNWQDMSMNPDGIEALAAAALTYIDGRVEK